jgi:spore maturation protein CgeB
VHSHSCKTLSFAEKVFFKLGLPLDRNLTNKTILQRISEEKFDCVFIVKGTKILPSVLKELRKQNIIIAGNSMDNIFKRHNSSHYLNYAIKNAYYDIFFLKNCNVYKSHAINYTQKFFFLNMAYDVNLHRKINNIRKKYQLLFVGSFELERFETLKFLASNGIKVDIFGNGWEHIKSKRNFNVHQIPLVGEEYVKAVNAAVINVNFLRKVNNDTQNSRAIELPACGAFTLQEWSSSLNDIFIDGREVVFFRDDQEILKHCRYYIKHNDERRKIAELGWKKTRNSNLSFDDVASETMAKLRGLQNNAKASVHSK